MRTANNTAATHKGAWHISFLLEVAPGEKAQKNSLPYYFSVLKRNLLTHRCIIYLDKMENHL